MGTAIFMAFGAHAGWIQGYILTSSGHSEAGLANVRRSVEFACYAAKVINNKNRALDWMHHKKDETARKRFSVKCKIPSTYKNQKYSHLWPLLVLYDTANYYGSHGNWETLFRKYQGITEKELILSFQDKTESIPLATGLITLIGYRLLRSLVTTFKSELLDRQVLENLLKNVSESIRDARLYLAEREYQGEVPDHVFKAINTDDKTETDLLFQEYIAREKKRS